MKVPIIVLAVLAGSICPALAADVTTSPGQPVCDTTEHLQEWLLAALQKQDRWMEELKQSCTSVKGGLVVGIIEKVSGDPEAFEVLKVRVMGAKSGSLVGYTVSAGLSGYKP